MSVHASCRIKETSVVVNVVLSVSPNEECYCYQDLFPRLKQMSKYSVEIKCLFAILVYFQEENGTRVEEQDLDSTSFSSLLLSRNE